MFSIARFTILKIFEPAFIFLLVFGFVLSYMTSGNQSLDLSFFTDITNTNTEGNLDIGSFILVMLSLIIAVFVGSTEIPRDLNTRMITILLCKPISRTKYVIGRFAGTWILSSMLYGSWLLALGIFQYLNMPDLFNAKSFMLNFLYIFALAPVSAVSVTVSTYLDDVPAMIISFILISISFTMGSIPIIITVIPDADLRRLVLLFYYLLPNFTYLFRSFEAAIHCLAFITYCIALSAMLLKVGITHFDDRDLC
ncbi:MAG: hypothetical protein NE328_18695 [Lentisphaeraceae bacterium]|nr:hypothetical protein [Lentisphaeraceae bacterium]